MCVNVDIYVGVYVVVHSLNICTAGDSAVVEQELTETTFPIYSIC